MVDSPSPNTVLKDELMSAYMDAGVQERKAIEELRKFRAQTPLVTITLLTAITPFAKEYVNLLFAFLVAYVLLFTSTIFGLLGIEGVLRSEIKNFGQFQHRTRAIIAELKKTKDINGAMKKFEASMEDDLDGQLASHLSDLSIRLFMIGLALLFISVFPWSLLIEVFNQVFKQ